MSFKKRTPCHTVLVGVFLLATAPRCMAGGASGDIRFDSTELSIETTTGVSVPISVEIAINDEQRAQGLMNRKSLEDGKGMIFVFDRDQIMSFWMKNTLIPLSIAFIASDGRILEIHDMEPLDLNSTRSSRSARYALEVPQGWFSRVGISVGDRLCLDTLLNQT
ncbi:MAG: DUF192 domain-containing protein [Treponema sp.]|jgi:uncharacterized membrane protein (UPF0127 family)|nr:DUF192 domain-containing protein [Treponema sp.]